MNNKKNKRPHKMYQSIISGLQEIIDDVTEQSKHKTDLDSLMFHDDAPLSTEDSLVNIIHEDTKSDKAQR